MSDVMIYIIASGCIFIKCDSNVDGELIE